MSPQERRLAETAGEVNARLAANEQRIAEPPRGMAELREAQERQAETLASLVREFRSDRQ